MLSPPATGQSDSVIPGATEIATAPGQLDARAAARLPVSDVLARLASARHGLSAAEAAERLRSVGPECARRASSLGTRGAPAPAAQSAAAAAARRGGRLGPHGRPDGRRDHRRDRGAQRRPRASSTSTAPPTPSRRCIATCITRRSSGATAPRSRSTSPSSCPATSWRCASATSCRPTCGCST